MKRGSMLGIFALGVFLLLGLVANPAVSAVPTGKPIVIGYVGNVASPGTKPCMDMQK